MTWIINNQIKFVQSKRMLISMDNTEIFVSLTNPASNCLALLLEHYPDVVPHKKFLDDVWLKDGIIVPLNTLYQNISIARRGFQKVSGGDIDIILTLPRKGFHINAEVSIEKVPCKHFLKETKIVELDEPCEPEKIGKLKNLEVTHTHSRYRSLLIFIAKMTIVIFAGLTLSLIYTGIDTKQDYFIKYKLIDKENGCNFLSIDNDFHSGNYYRKYKGIIQKSSLDCQKYPWVYFSSSSGLSSLAVIACKKPYQESGSPLCVTHYFRGVHRYEP